MYKTPYAYKPVSGRCSSRFCILFCWFDNLDSLFHYGDETRQYQPRVKKRARTCPVPNPLPDDQTYEVRTQHCWKPMVMYADQVFQSHNQVCRPTDMTLHRFQRRRISKELCSLGTKVTGPMDCCCQPCTAVCRQQWDDQKDGWDAVVFQW